MTIAIHFSVPTTDPEAFDAEWKEWNDTIEENTPREERDLCDIVREHDESDENCPNSDPAEEWDRLTLRYDMPWDD